jgi:hypothetical protein
MPVKVIRDEEGRPVRVVDLRPKEALNDISTRTIRRSKKPRRPVGRVKSPVNGAVVRGVWYPGGKFVPAEGEELWRLNP